MSGGPNAAIYNIVYVLALFACVVAHEYGHALMARRFGIRTPDITLLPIGGLARLERMPEKPGREILVALAGPAVNVVIFAVLWLIVGVSPEPPLSDGLSFASLPAQIATLNLILALFNMIPAFPMDGGRVLRAFLSFFMKRVSATRVAAFTGQAVAVLGGAYGLWTGQFILVLIAVFIFMGARAESTDVQLRASIEGRTARDAMIADYVVLRPGDGPEVALQSLTGAAQSVGVVKDFATGKVVGVVTRDALRENPGAERVGDIMSRKVAGVPVTAPLGKVLQAVGRDRIVLAVTPQGDVAGVITRESAGAVIRDAQGR